MGSMVQGHKGTHSGKEDQKAKRVTYEARIGYLANFWKKIDRIDGIGASHKAFLFLNSQQDGNRDGIVQDWSNQDMYLQGQSLERCIRRPPKEVRSGQKLQNINKDDADSNPRVETVHVGNVSTGFIIV